MDLTDEISSHKMEEEMLHSSRGSWIQTDNATTKKAELSGPTKSITNINLIFSEGECSRYLGGLNSKVVLSLGKLLGI